MTDFESGILKGRSKNSPLPKFVKQSFKYWWLLGPSMTGKPQEINGRIDRVLFGRVVKSRGQRAWTWAKSVPENRAHRILASMVNGANRVPINSKDEWRSDLRFVWRRVGSKVCPTILYPEDQS